MRLPDDFIKNKDACKTCRKRCKPEYCCDTCGLNCIGRVTCPLFNYTPTVKKRKQRETRAMRLEKQWKTNI